jgi:hypothetical protein
MIRKLVSIAFCIASLGSICRAAAAEEFVRSSGNQASAFIRFETAFAAHMARAGQLKLGATDTPWYTSRAGGVDDASTCGATLDANFDAQCAAARPPQGFGVFQWLVNRVLQKRDSKGNPVHDRTATIRVTPTMAAGGYGVMVAGTF